MNCKHCKSKNTRHRRRRNGKEQFVCKDCWKYFTIEQEKKVDKKKEKKPSKVREEHQVDRRQTTFNLLETIVEMWLENETLEKRLDHADKVNLANVKFMQEVREENANLYNRIARRNVAICLLVAGLAIVSGMLFY